MLIGAILGSPAFSAAIPTLQPVTESVMHVRINSKEVRINSPEGADGTSVSKMFENHVVANIEYSNSCLSGAAERMTMVKEESVDSHGKRLVSIELFYLPSAEEENCTAIYDPVRVEVDLAFIARPHQVI